jgi:CHAT domain-containing protein/tetratricopeptide (TPR) repeat protein
MQSQGGMKDFAKKSAPPGRARKRLIVGTCLPIFVLLLSAPFPAIYCLPLPVVAPPDNTAALAPGTSVRRELNKGETHAYRIALAAGQYFRATIFQTGNRMGVAVYAPSGQKINELDCRQYEATPVSVIAADAGLYRVEVRSLEKEAGAGGYQLKVEEVRPAMAQDRNRVAGERAFAEGTRLRAEGKLESSRKAAAKYDEAVEQWHVAGEPYQEACALKTAGETYHQLGEPQKALHCFDRGLAIARLLNDPRLEGDILNAMGFAYLYLGENQKALTFCERALKLNQDTGNKRGEAQSFNNLAEGYYYGGDMQKALNGHRRALAIWQSLADRQGQAQTLQYIGHCFSALGEMSQAIDAFTRALPLCRLLDDRNYEALTLTGIGQVYSKSGEEQKALALYNEALILFQARGDKVWEAITFCSISYAYGELGDKGRSLEYYNKALRLFQSVSYRTGEAGSLLRIGLIHYSGGDSRKALAHFQQALSIIREIADRAMEANALNHIGQVYAAMGDRARALDYFNRALPLFQATEDRRGEAYALDNIGKVYDGLNEKAKALDYYSRALMLNRATEDRIGETATLCNIARAERDLGKLAEARAHLEDSINKIEALRIKVADHELRATYFATAQQNYELYIDLLMRLSKERPQDGLDAAALHVGERARARSLLEALAESRADIRRGVDPSLLERERALQQLLDDRAERQSRLLNAKHSDEQAAAAAKEIEALTTDYQQIRAQIRSRSPRYAALTQPQPLTLKQIQQQVLDGDSLLLEYALGDERSYLWAVTNDSLSSYELPPRAAIDRAARRVYDLLTAANQKVKGESALQKEERLARAEADYAQAAADLSRMILEPVAARLGSRRLLVVADGALQYIPFAALAAPPQGPGAGGRAPEAKAPAGHDARHDARSVTAPSSRVASGRPAAGGYRPLIADHEIISLPSASALGVLRGELAGRKPAEKAVAVLADPVFSADDERLSLARRHEGGAARPAPTLEAGGPGQTRDFERALDEAGLSRDGTSIARLSFSRREAEAIALAAAGQALKAVDFDASRATATGGELSRYRIVHLATHGLLNSEHPELSGIVLSLVDREGRPQNGFLRLHEIYNLNLPAELVVLSACQTGLGKEVRGEGLVGLTRGFMYAGAARVMASLWKVDDAATAELMKRLYGKMLQEGMRPSAALRAAQVEMWQQPRWQGPYYWAAFVLQGEWR